MSTSCRGRQVCAAIKTIKGIDHAEERAGLISSFLLGVAYSRYIARIPAVANLHTSELRARIAPMLQFIIDRHDF